ncbi:hypothetical protein NMG60_11031563 [Bertholletia excelsa]
MPNDGVTNDEWNEEEYKSYVDLKPDEIIGKEFESIEKAYEFYCTYAKFNGFVVRKDDIGKNTRGEVIWRQYVCNKEGLRNKKHFMRTDRKREHRVLTRTKCCARMRIYVKKGGAGWKVTIFDATHNHHLSSADKVHMMSAYHNMKDPDKIQVNDMHSMRVRTCYIFGFMNGQSGGYFGLGFCKKDLYNQVNGKRRANIADGDAYAVLSYLQAKGDSDPMFWGKYQVNEADGCLLNLFWADGMSRTDYECFGDVVAFDSTYKMSRYNKPVVIFSGVNHHGLTCLFGCALLSDESFENYKWVLTSFLEAMGGKEPKVVVTDGEKSMWKAIKVVMPSASRRLCPWHMNNDAAKNVQNSNFLKKFKDCVYANFDPDEFEEFWADMVEEFGLSDNKWVKKAYKRKEMWATGFHRERFYFGIRASRCEGTNAFIDKCTSPHDTLVEFVHNYERIVREYRNDELVADFDTMYEEPVITSALGPLEKGAANVYTGAMYKEFKVELNEAAAFFVVQRDETEDRILFMLNKYCRPRRVYEVRLERKEERFVCYCRSYENNGIPCSHIICVLKYEHLAQLPPSLICHRWTKAAKIVNTLQGDENSRDRKTFMSRYGLLGSACNWLSFLAAQNREDFNEVKSEIFKLTSRLEKQRSKSIGGVKDLMIDVDDVSIVETRGAPKKKRKSCEIPENSRCHTIGHTRKGFSKHSKKQLETAGDNCAGKSTYDANDSNTKEPAPTSSNRSAMNESSQHIFQGQGAKTMSNMHGHLNSAYYGASVQGQYGQLSMFPHSNYSPMYSPSVGAAMFPYVHGPSNLLQGFGGVPFMQSTSFQMPKTQRG